MTAASLPLRFQIGARTLAAIPRRLVRVPLSLDDALAGFAPALLPLARDADGYSVTSLPADAVDALAAPVLLRHVRQRYTRRWIDLAAGEAAWRAGLSPATRSALGRKTRRLLGAGARVEAYRGSDAIAAFHRLARPLAARTYQERLLGTALPADPAPLLALAAADRVRAWLLVLAGEPVAYLCCTADGATLRYDHVGHDPAHAAHSPGTVLLGAALAALFAEPAFARFDFTEGDGQHKRTLATGGVACLDLLLLRPTLANRAGLAALAGFDTGVGVAKRAARHPLLAGIVRRARQ